MMIVELNCGICVFNIGKRVDILISHNGKLGSEGRFIRFGNTMSMPVLKEYCV